MSQRSFLPLPLLACLALLVGGALGPQSTSSAPFPAPAPSAQFVGLALPAARKDPDPLKAAISRLESIRWLEVNLWQEKRDEEGACTVEGRYLSAPNHRRRLEIEVTHERAHGRLTMVSNGTHFWKGMKPAKGPLRFSHQPLPQLSDNSSDAETVGRRITTCLDECGFPNLVTLLESVRSRLTNTRVDTGLWNEKPVLRVRGTMAADARGARAADEVCLFLDAETLWPHRLEWWSATGAGGRRLLVKQVELRHPIVNRPLSEPAGASAFTYRMD